MFCMFQDKTIPLETTAMETIGRGGKSRVMLLVPDWTFGANPCSRGDTMLMPWFGCLFVEGEATLCTDRGEVTKELFATCPCIGGIEVARAGLGIGGDRRPTALEYF